MKQISKIFVMCFVLCSMLTGCSNNDLAAQREKNTAKADSIMVGVPVPLEFAKKNTQFLKGLELAQEEINSLGVNGKKIELKIVDDKGIFKTAVDIAQGFSADTSMVAVVGHWYSDICIPVSNIYEDAGMLTIVPTVSNPDLTEKGYKYVFQSITSDKKIAEAMCDYAKSKGYKRIVVCYEDSSYGTNLAEALEKKSKENSLKIVDRTYGLVTEEQFKAAFEKWKALEFDAVLLALNMPEGATYIRELRALDQETGIICADGLDVASFIPELGKAAEGVMIANSYSPYNQRPELVQFTEKYQEKYNEQPDVWAIQGYEALQLITYAIKQTNSYSPIVLADYLRKMEPLQTVLGEISFNQYGEIEGRDIYKKIVVDGQFKYVD